MTVSYPLPNLDTLTDIESNEHSVLDDYLLNQLFSLLTQKQNLHGRRIGKAKDAISPGDYVTKRQLNGTLVGTLAQRPQPSNVVQGTTYFATDRNVTYIERGGHWYYYSGIQYVTLNPDTKPSPSVLYDTGYMIYATDFDWYYKWNLITWERIGGTSLYPEGFFIDFAKPGWHKADGTTNVVYSKDDGSTGLTNMPDWTTTPRYVKYGPTNTNIAAVVPTITGNTGSSGSHNHTLTPLGHLTGSVTAILPNHTHDATNTYTGPPKTSGGAGSWGTTAHFTLDGTTQVTDVDHQHYNTLCVNVGVNSGSQVGGLGPTSVASDGHVHTGTAVGYSDTVIGTLAHDHGAGSLTVETNTEHYHIVDFPTGGVTTLPQAITVINTMGFSGDSTTTSSDGAHTHTGSSLTISSDGSPIATQLIPYIRL